MRSTEVTLRSWEESPPRVNRRFPLAGSSHEPRLALPRPSRFTNTSVKRDSLLPSSPLSMLCPLSGRSRSRCRRRPLSNHIMHPVSLAVSCRDRTRGPFVRSSEKRLARSNPGAVAERRRCRTRRCPRGPYGSDAATMAPPVPPDTAPEHPVLHPKISPVHL